MNVGPGAPGPAWVSELESIGVQPLAVMRARLRLPAWCVLVVRTHPTTPDKPCTLPLKGPTPRCSVFGAEGAAPQLLCCMCLRLWGEAR